MDISPDVGLSVTSFGTENLWHGPASCNQIGDITFLEFSNDRAISCKSQLTYRRAVWTRINVYEISTVFRECLDMISILRSQIHKVFSVETDAAIVKVVRILARYKSGSRKVDHLIFLIYIIDLTHYPFTLCYLPDNLSLVIMQINVAPSVSLGNP